MAYASGVLAAVETTNTNSFEESWLKYVVTSVLQVHVTRQLSKEIRTVLLLEACILASIIVFKIFQYIIVQGIKVTRPIKFLAALVTHIAMHLLN